MVIGTQNMKIAGKLLFAVALVIVPTLTCASGLPNAPAPQSRLIALNGADALSSFFVAGAAWYGAHQCVVREELKRKPRHDFWKALAISGAFETATAITSFHLRRSHPAV